MLKRKGKYSFLAGQIFLFFLGTLGITFGAQYLFNSIRTSLAVASINAYYVGDSTILGDNLLPISNRDVASKAVSATFTVKGASDNPDTTIYYDVSLRDINITSNLISSDFKWQLLKDNVVIANGDFGNLKVQDQIYQRVILTPTVLELPAYVQTADTITLRIYILSTDADQSLLMGQSFGATLGVDLYTSMEGNEERAKYTNLVSYQNRINTFLDDVKYIKDCVGGNSADSNNYWGEIKALVGNDNVVNNAIITFTNDYSNNLYPIANLVDDNIDTLVDGGSGEQCVVLELDDFYDLDSVTVWHDYLTDKIYYDNVTYVSSDNINWVNVINELEIESYMGKSVSASTVIDNNGDVRDTMME